MSEARFVRDSMLYHLLPIGINFSIDKLKVVSQTDKEKIKKRVTYGVFFKTLKFFFTKFYFNYWYSEFLHF